MKAPTPPREGAHAPPREFETEETTSSREQSQTPAGSINGPLRVVSRTAPKAQRVWAARLLRAITPAVDALSAIGEHQETNVNSRKNSS